MSTRHALQQQQGCWLPSRFSWFSAVSGAHELRWLPSRFSWLSAVSGAQWLGLPQGCSRTRRHVTVFTRHALQQQQRCWLPSRFSRFSAGSGAEELRRLPSRFSTRFSMIFQPNGALPTYPGLIPNGLLIGIF